MLKTCDILIPIRFGALIIQIIFTGVVIAIKVKILFIKKLIGYNY